MIVVNAENIRIFAIMVLGTIWFFLLVQQIQENSEED